LQWAISCWSRPSRKGTLTPAFATTLVGPGGGSCPPTILDHPRILAQRDGPARPALDRGPSAPGEVFDDAGTVAAPYIDAEVARRAGYPHPGVGGAGV